MKKNKVLKIALTCVVFFGIFVVPELFDGPSKKIAWAVIFAIAIPLAIIIYVRQRREV